MLMCARKRARMHDGACLCPFWGAVRSSTSHSPAGIVNPVHYMYNVNMELSNLGSMSSELKSPEQCRIHQIELNKKSIEQIQI